MTKSFFATSIYHKPILKASSRLHREVREEAPFIRERDREGQAWSQERYPNGFTSYGSLDQLHHLSSTFLALKKSIDPHVAAFAKALGFTIHPRELQMTRMWVNIMGQNCGHGWHSHPLSVISGSYYVQMPKACAGIKFEDPRLAFFMARPPVMDRGGHMPAIVELRPSAGDVVLFESWLKHEVPLHPSPIERITVSFNYDWVGGGAADTDTSEET